MWLTGLLALGACASGSRPAALPRAARPDLDARVRKLMAAAHVPGLALAILEDGEPAYEAAYGVRNAAGAPLTVDTVMYAASLTKTAFAYAVMTLVDEGVLDLDRSIGGYLPKPLPEYPKYVDLAGDPRWKRFTARMLLSHTTGMPNYRWVNDDEKLDIKFEPGARFGYSGEGINLLQLVIEEGLRRDVGALLQERVFRRFGMTRTSMTWRDDFAGREADGFGPDGALLPHERRTSARAAGSMDTTLADYARFLGGVLRGEGLSPRAHAEMLKAQIAIDSVAEFPSHWESHTQVYAPVALSYGLGWGLFQSPARGPAFFKEGHDDGTNNVALGFPRSRSGLVVLSNSGNAESLFAYLIEDLFGDICMPWFWSGYVPYDRPELRAPAAREHPPEPCGLRPRE